MKHLCIHCSKNNELSKCPNIPPENQHITYCVNFSQKLFPYCPHCGTPFTLANDVNDPDSSDTYLNDNFTSPDLIALTCLECGETSLVEDTIPMED